MSGERKAKGTVARTMPILTHRQCLEALARLDACKETTTEIARSYNVERSTIRRLIADKTLRTIIENPRLSGKQLARMLLSQS
jgi:hypothetical protein